MIEGLKTNLGTPTSVTVLRDGVLFRRLVWFLVLPAYSICDAGVDSASDLIQIFPDNLVRQRAYRKTCII